jgi:ABC-type transporter Mla subunit MlaD
MASIKDVEQVADNLENLVERFRAELRDGPDFDKLIEIADEISERADNAAEAFNNINEALTSRISELSGRKRSGGSRSGQSQRAKAESSTS